MAHSDLVLAPAPERLFGHMNDLNRDMLQHLDDLAGHGDFVKARYSWLWIYYLNHPELIRDLLVKKGKSTQKPFSQKRAFVSYASENILTSDGDFWKRQRKLMQPAFHSQRIGAYANDMVALTRQAMADWDDTPIVDINAFMADLTMRIIVKTMFSTDVDETFADVGETITAIIENSAEDLVDMTIWLPNWIPTKRVRRNKANAARLAPIYQRMIDAWCKEGVDRGDLLSMLMLARYDDGSAMSEAQIMSELSVIFLAGHETTAKTLTFAAIMLSQHPTVAEKLRAEVDHVLGNRPATLHDLEHLTYTKQIIKETMRLYPAATAIGREVAADMELGGETIKKGRHVIVNTWAVHRDERWYPEPLAFKPERWTPEFEAELPRYAYVPFGAGPRVCLGNQFSMMEAQLVLATIAQHYSLQLQPGTIIEPTYRLTLHPGPDTVPMQVNVREAVFA
ncbi:MAG: cytochrome P450 [Chloroflexota bacterium]